MMQTLNKSLAKNTFTYTWYLYPIAAVFLTLLWLWAFPVVHQPTAHEKIELYIDTDVKSEKFAKNILTQYDPHQLRAINIDYPSGGMGASQKFRMGLERCDMMILTEGAVSSYKNSGIFAEITPYIQEKCQIDSSLIIEGYGIRLKQANTAHYLDEYISFDTNYIYLLVLLARSKNLGAAINEDNAQYDNALTVAHYILEGVQ